MATGAAGKVKGRSMVVALLATLAAPVLGYAVVRNAAVDAAGSAANPTAVLPPRSAVPEMRALMRGARDPEKPLPADALSIAERAALVLPLAHEPFYIAARVAEQAGRYDRATILMEEARRRRPNATAVHIALLGYYSLADAYHKAINEADFAMRINSRSKSLILPAFAKLVAADPKARQAIAVALAKNPPWRDEFLDAATTENMTPAVAQALVADIRRLRPANAPEAEEAFLVRTLAAAGRYRDALALRTSYLPAGARAKDIVVDPDFRGGSFMKPFGWTLQSGRYGTAEFAKVAAGARSMLEVTYFGDTEIALATQTLAAAPGAYRLSTVVSGNSSAPDVGLAWDLSCLPGPRSLGRLRLQPLGERPARRDMTITIPGGGCQGQQLSLLGQPGDVSRTLGAQIMEVSLVPAGSAETRR